MNPIGKTVARWVVSIWVLAGAGLAADVSSGAEPPQPVTVKFQLDKRALDTSHGVAVTYLRIRNGARSVCGFADRVFWQEQAGWDACVATTIRHTVEQIGNDRLTDFYIARSGTPRSQLSEGIRVGSRLP